MREAVEELARVKFGDGVPYTPGQTGLIRITKK
jgi:hypothetical protein